MTNFTRIKAVDKSDLISFVFINLKRVREMRQTIKVPLSHTPPTPPLHWSSTPSGREAGRGGREGKQKGIEAGEKQDAGRAQGGNNLGGATRH